jgi:Arc/MetJ-type ribon-helix-helix transcriptional regulator
MDKELDKKLEDRVRNSVFRSKSHLVEYAIESFLKQNKIVEVKG